MASEKKPLPMPPSNQDLKSLIRFEDESGLIWLGEQRMLLLHASAFGALRHELIESFGEEYAKGILMRMGHTSAVSDAQLAKELRSNGTLMDRFMVGPQLHALEGIVSVEPVSINFDDETGAFHGEFIWKNSFEATEHLRLYGVTDHPVCWQLQGYATGYTSSLMGSSIHYKEVECVAKGDEQCRIVGKPLHEWEDAEELEKMFSLGSMAVKLQALKDEVEDLREESEEYSHPKNIVADSAPIKEVMFLLSKAAATNVTVLMLGETGVGKEIFSQALHKMGERREDPFVAVNCAALPKDLVESELFGVEKGAFTGADKSRAGRFERAHGGTLFLDELGELGLEAQAKLLRVIQTGEVERVGDTKVIKVDVRLIAATNADLMERVKAGTFRADLYYRINVFPITVPPLSERTADIPGLINKFIRKFNKKYGKDIIGVTDETFQHFLSYSWPGNIRELENILERGVILASNHSRIESTHVCIGMSKPEATSMGIDDQGELKRDEEIKHDDISINGFLSSAFEQGASFESLEKQILQAALEQASGNVEKASRLLKITGPQLRYRIKKLHISNFSNLV